MASGFEEKSRFVDLDAQGHVIATRDGMIQGGLISSVSADAVVFSDDRSPVLWTLRRDGSLVQSRQAALTRGLAAAPSGGLVVALNVGEHADTYVNRVQRLTPLGQVTTSADLEGSVNWMGMVGHALVVTASDTNYEGVLYRLDPDTLKVLGTYRFPALFGARHCRPVSDVAISCIDQENAQGKPQDHNTLAHYDVTTGRRTVELTAAVPETVVEGVLLTRLPVPHQEVLLSAEGLGKASKSQNWKPTLVLSHDSLVVDSLIGVTGNQADILLRQINVNGCDDPVCTIGEIVRVNLATMSVERRTPLTDNGDRELSLDLVVPQEFFDGKAVVK